MSKGSKFLVLAFAMSCVGGAVAQTPPQSASPAGQAASASRPEFVLKGSIATITELSQQLKIEQLKKDLREAKATANAEKSADASRQPPGSVGAAAARVKIEQPPAPVVKAIYGLGGKLTARLADGREVGEGQRVYGWVVKRITPITVAFERCEAGKTPAGRDPQPCASLSVGPSAI